LGKSQKDVDKKWAWLCFGRFFSNSSGHPASKTSSLQMSETAVFLTINNKAFLQARDIKVFWAEKMWQSSFWWMLLRSVWQKYIL
jgi:hypothetical protein